MPEGGILLDLTSCRDWGMVQDAIRRAFGFPAHYGENWDAMWDCLTDLFWVTDDRHIVVRGLDALPSDLRAYAEPLRQVLEDLRTRCPRLRVTYCFPFSTICGILSGDRDPTCPSAARRSFGPAGPFSKQNMGGTT